MNHQYATKYSMPHIKLAILQVVEPITIVW